MRVMAAQAIRLLEWLVLMCLLQFCTLRIMAIQAKCWTGFRQMKIKLRFSRFARLMRGVASVAAHVQGGVAASFGGYVQTGVVATQAEVLFFVPGNGFEQLVLVFRAMRVMALQAIPDGR